MTFRSWLPKIQIHPILMIFIFISFVTGTFLELSVILFLVLFHELGHYMMARLFKWRIHGVMLWVFGGVMDTDEHGNRPIREEILVTLAGPLQHLVVYGIILAFGSVGIIPQQILDTVLYYNSAILFFNLLPIWPLDGGKLLLLIFSSILPYKKSYNYTIIFSMIACLIFICFQFFPFTLSSFLVMTFLFMENRNEWKQRYYVFIRFLLNRYEGASQVKSVQPITVSHKLSMMGVFTYFKRDKRHSIYIEYPENKRISVDENECLRSYFHDKQFDRSIGEVFQNVP